MKNYEYILTSLPNLVSDLRGTGEDNSSEDLLSFIRENLSKKDEEHLDFFLKGFDSEQLNAEFYQKAALSKVPFIKNYFDFDLKLRNAKVRYLNSRLGRPADTDVVPVEGQEDFEEADRLEEVFSKIDILDREQALDDLIIEKVDALTLFNYFDMDAILAFVCKLHLAQRWLKLDPEKGKDLFRSILKDLRGTYEELEYKG